MRARRWIRELLGGASESGWLGSDERRLRPTESLKGPGQIAIGRRTYWSNHTRMITFGTQDVIRIGAFCCFSPGTVLLAGGNHSTKALSGYPFSLLDEPTRPSREPERFESIVIGNDVWIGMNAIIVGSVKIGDGAVIAAGAVVTRDIAAYDIVAGVPAGRVRPRFPKAVVERMGALRWWDWPDEDIRDAEDLLRAFDLDALEDYASRRGLLPVPTT